MIGSVCIVVGVLVGDEFKARHDLFVVITMLAVPLVTNLAVGFTVGIGVACLLKTTGMRV